MLELNEEVVNVSYDVYASGGVKVSLKDGQGQPYDNITTCIDTDLDMSMFGDCGWVKENGYCTDYGQWLVDNKLAVQLPMTVEQGFNEYRLYRFRNIPQNILARL